MYLTLMINLNFIDAIEIKLRNILPFNSTHKVLFLINHK